MFNRRTATESEKVFKRAVRIMSIVYILFSLLLQSDTLIQEIIMVGTFYYILMAKPIIFIVDKKMTLIGSIIIIVAMILFGITAYHPLLSLIVCISTIVVWKLVLSKNNNGQKAEIERKNNIELKRHKQKEEFKEKLSSFIKTIELEELNHKRENVDIEIIDRFIKITKQYFSYKMAYEKYWKQMTNDFNICLYNIDISKDSKQIPLKDKIILTHPWAVDRVVDVSQFTEDEFKQRINDKTYTYYKNLEICTVSSGGNHRLFRQLIDNGDVQAKCKVYDEAPILENCYTDGYEIFNMETNEIEGEFGYYEIAVYFVLKQLEMYRKNKPYNKYKELLELYREKCK